MSVLRVAFNLRFTLPWDMYPNIDRIKNVKCKVLIMHAIKDDIVPFGHGKELYKNCQYAYEPLFVDGVSHNNLDKIWDEIFLHINNFLKALDSSYVSNLSIYL
jgi:fermentation-respiration switch protein FrsA (DUF1100 family)